jgi:23S rRNA (adenine2503-C2)-methyltransferase
MSSSTNIYNLDYTNFLELLKGWGLPTYRTEQIWRGLYQQYYTSPNQFTSLPTDLRNRLSENFAQPGENNQVTFSRIFPERVQFSSDGETQKTLFRLSSSQEHRQTMIEAVLMRYRQRSTICISTQIGCGMGCTFCATGQMGFTRHLSSGEIVEQVIYFARQLALENQKITNIVIMGMGEPFHNYDATLQAIDRLNDAHGMDFSARRFTISTVGLVPMIRKFADEKRQVNLAISLHASNDELRTSMLPINKKYPIAELMAACKYYVLATRRRITFEWALINGTNDSPEEARRLGQLLQQLRTPEGALLVHVNAIPLNPTKEFSGQATNRQRAMEFKAVLESLGIPCTVRLRRGIDIQAGCGQLAIENKPIK